MGHAGFPRVQASRVRANPARDLRVIEWKWNRKYLSRTVTNAGRESTLRASWEIPRFSESTRGLGVLDLAAGKDQRLRRPESTRPFQQELSRHGHSPTEELLPRRRDEAGQSGFL